MKKLTCDLCGTDEMVKTYQLARGILEKPPKVYSNYNLPFPFNQPIYVEVCNLCFQQVGERYKKFLVENNLVKGK